MNRFVKLSVTFSTFVFVFLCFSTNQFQSQTQGQENNDPVFSSEMLHGTVKMHFDENNGMLTLIGAPSDVEIVRRTVATFKKRFDLANKQSPVRIRLENQLAETAVEILKNSLPPSLQNLKINAVSFPEAIVVVGTKNQIEQVEKIIDSIDSIGSTKRITPSKFRPLRKPREMQSKPIPEALKFLRAISN